MPKERQTCTECSMRRQKCDRNIPCARCIKRGDASKCTREWKDGYDPARHRIYPRPESKGDGSPSSQYHSDRGSSASPAETNNRRKSNISSAVGDQSEAAVHPSLRSQSTKHVSTNNPDPETTKVPSNTNVLDFLAWGKTPLSNFQINSIELTKDGNNCTKDPTTDWNYSNGFGGTGSAQISFLQLLLPSRRQVNQLVDYHLSCLTWYHSAVHGPTFDRELKEQFNGATGLQIRDMDLRWAALLFSIMAASMTCASDQQTETWGFKKVERAQLTRQWFKATLSCLNLADYMWRHHIASVQAIAVLTMSAHILGFSNTQSTLMGAALKIAQGLGLQRLGPEEEVTSGVPQQKEKLIRRETGRRLWYQLCIQDWFSIPFSEMYSIQKHHFTTILPQSLHDETMAPIPTHVPTMSSFGNNLQELARLMADSHDAVMTSSTLFTRYDQVLQSEKKIRRWLDDLPKCMSMTEPIDPSWPSWVTWARRSLLLCFAHKIIMIHRNFLGRSFEEPAFAHTREACMTAAKTILKEVKYAHDEGGPILWIDQAFMVAAGITLSLDIFHRKPADPEYEEHRKLVQNDINMLSKFEDSMIAARGTRLLSSLLTEQARSTATQSLNTYRGKRSRETDGNQAASTSTAIASEQPQVKRQRQKFDVPRFVESLGGNDTTTNALQAGNGGDSTSSNYGMPNLFGPSPTTQTTNHSTTPSTNTNTNPNFMPNFATSTYNNGIINPISTNSFTSSMGTSIAPPPAPATSSGAATTTHTSNRPQITQNVSSILQPQDYFNSSSNNNNDNGNDTNIDPGQSSGMDFGYETFEQLFPPQTGISNSFLFEDLLNFDF